MSATYNVVTQAQGYDFKTFCVYEMALGEHHDPEVNFDFVNLKHFVDLVLTCLILRAWSLS